jgi:8-oxo-dGTP diphosphatase
VNAAPPRPVTRVAVGVLVRADGAVLLADRPEGKPYAGYWEFPGGKIESGESVEQALARELAEELGVHVLSSLPWVTMEYDYPHAYVRLYFRRIHDWTGTPRPVEGQRLQFLRPGDVPPQPLLPAALPALRWMDLPAVTGLAPDALAGGPLDGPWLRQVLDRGLRQIVWPAPPPGAVRAATDLAAGAALARSYGARLYAAGAAPADGVDLFLSAAELRRAAGRPACAALAAEVQTRADLELAQRLGCDFVVHGPAAGGAHDALARLLVDAPLPVYVRGDLGIDALRRLQALGAQGLAASID